MPVLTPYAAQEMAMVSRTPGGSGLPIGLMPGAFPSDQASRQTLNTTAMRFPFGHSHFEFFKSTALFSHDVVCANDLAPAIVLILDEARGFLGRGAHRLDIERPEFLLDVRHPQDRDRGRGDLLLQ